MSTTDRVEIRDEDFLVHVKAQVMVRDDSKGGWVPRGAGGMSIVGLCQLLQSSACGSSSLQFIIFGRRIADRSVVLNCAVNRDLQYTKANPTFHHWRTEGKRYGLTFQSSTEARLFEKAIRKAVENVREGHVDKTPATFRGEIEAILTKHCSLSLDRNDSISRPESTASTTVSTPSVQSPTSPSAPPFPVYPEQNGSPQPLEYHQHHSTITPPPPAPSIRTLPAFILRTPRAVAAAADSPSSTFTNQKPKNGGDGTLSSLAMRRTGNSGLATSTADTRCAAHSDPPWYRTFPLFVAASRSGTGSGQSSSGWHSWPAVVLPVTNSPPVVFPPDSATPDLEKRMRNGLLDAATAVANVGGSAIQVRPASSSSSCTPRTPPSTADTGSVVCVQFPASSPIGPVTAGALPSNGHEEYVHFGNGHRSSDSSERRASATHAGADTLSQTGKNCITAGGFDYSYPQLESVVPNTASTSSFSPRPPAVPPVVRRQVQPMTSLPFPPTVMAPRITCRPAVATDDRPSHQLLTRTARCVYCQETFTAAENVPGACSEAPSTGFDKVYRVVDWLSCGACARLIMDRCCNMTPVGSPDEDNDVNNDVAHPCAWPCLSTGSCGANNGGGGGGDRVAATDSRSGCNGCRRWAALGAVSLMVPCVLCYWPLTLCGRGSVACCQRANAGKHRAI